MDTEALLQKGKIMHGFKNTMVCYWDTCNLKIGSVFTMTWYRHLYCTVYMQLIVKCILLKRAVKVVRSG
jgi:hypothetical protein